MPLLLTVDTNVLRDCAESTRPGHPVAIELLGLHHSGQCEIRTTTRLDADVPNEPLNSELNALNPLPPMSTVFRFDVSRFDHDVFSDDKDIADEPMLMNLIFPKSSPSNSKHKNRLADIDHLLGHRLHRRDLFVTREKAILAQATALADKFGINVGSPEEALRQVRDAK